MLIDNFASVIDDISAATVAGSPVLTGNTYDLGAAGTVPQFLGGGIGGNGSAPTTVTFDVSKGLGMRMWLKVITAVTSGGSATLKADFVMADDAALTSNKTVLLSSAAIAKATLVAGYNFAFDAIPLGITKRYVGFQYTVATADLTGGKVEWGFTPSDQLNF